MNASRLPDVARPGFIGRGRIESLRTRGNSPAVLALHGFGCTPNEVLLFSKLAQQRRLAFSAPLLPGHGTHPKDLARTRYDDWYAAAEDEYLNLADRGPVIVCGQSMGAVLALELASKHSEGVLGLVALANATRLCSPYPALALRAAVRLRLPDLLMPKYFGPDISASELKDSHLTYDSQPMYAAESLRQAGSRVRNGLGRVRCPAFIAHGRRDHVCPVANAWDVATRLGTTDVEVVLLARSFHVLTKDHDQEQLSTRLSAFLDRVVPPPTMG